MTSTTDMQKRLSAEELAYIRGHAEGPHLVAMKLKPCLRDALAHITALEAELAGWKEKAERRPDLFTQSAREAMQVDLQKAYDERDRAETALAALKRPVDDAEVMEAVALIRYEAKNLPAYRWPRDRAMEAAADLITRLVREKAEALDARDELFRRSEEWKHTAGLREAERDEARDKALEEAVKAINQLAFFRGGKAAKDCGYREACAHAVRDIHALSPKPDTIGEGR